MTDGERGALGELIKMSRLFYVHDKDERDHRNRSFGVLCAERAKGILEGKVTPHFAADEDIAAFQEFWKKPPRRKRGGKV